MSRSHREEEIVMHESLDELVRDVVARHLDVDVNDIGPDLHLQHDLHLDPLDLVLIALRLEEMEQREFPIYRLGLAETVGDIADVVAAMRDGGFEEAIFTLDDPTAAVSLRAHRTRRRGHRAKRTRRAARVRGGVARNDERVSSRSR
jgi:acyl carrier protein